MPLEVGQIVPKGSLTIMGPKGPQVISTEEIFSEKSVVLLAVPGAFTPTCAVTHLPGFVTKLDEFTAKGIDTVACLAVNDIFVIDAWSKASNAEHILMLSDGNAEYTHALDMVLDLSGFGMGLRSQRYAMVVDNHEIKYIGVDPEGVEKSSADAVLAFLK